MTSNNFQRISIQVSSFDYTIDGKEIN